jgi:methionine sulfoxide reductase heme-binding subunit
VAFLLAVAGPALRVLADGPASASGPLIRGLLTNTPPLTALPGAHPHPLSSGVVVMPSSPLWYTTRATGLVALVLLTISMALGLLSSVGYQRPDLPRFVTAGLHRNASLLALAFTAVHVITTVIDSYVSIPVQDAFIPFIASYRPIWLGLGAIASDLLLALTVTSLLRARMSYRSWRLAHWTSYACWPVAVLHGLGTGSDTPVRWVLVLTLVCTAVVVVGVGWRLAVGWPAHRAARLAGAVALVVALVAGGAWLAAGPLRAGWARRAGTPPALVHHAAGPAGPSQVTP